MARIKVMYLSRAINDPRFSWAFFDSLARHAAGLNYDLILASKGFAEGQVDPTFTSFRSRIGCENVEIYRYEDGILPIPLYRDVANRCDGDLIIFFTSWSRILAPNWLRYYVEAFEKVDNCGIVGASGGYEKLSASTPFPNVGIRTNAFMVPVTLFRSLEFGDLETSWGGNLFEAGPNGMTKQIAARGLEPVIVDRFGKYWHSPDWAASNTFRASQQERLLVADNRTYHFHVASIRKRRRLASRCWGSDQRVVRRPLLCKLADWYDWNYPRGVVDVGHDLAEKIAVMAGKVVGKSPEQPKRVFPG